MLDLDLPLDLDLDDILAPNLPRLEVPCRPFGQPATLLLVLPVEASSLLAAIWRWPRGGLGEATIGRA